ncbi:hypothetical protein GGR51DRAFT_496935 [Nemania sp. FL0031]|nr:hypothetical protein GGR51DRAFT_496935 [Nemania sp. FL0031]
MGDINSEARPRQTLSKASKVLNKKLAGAPSRDMRRTRSTRSHKEQPPLKTGPIQDTSPITRLRRGQSTTDSESASCGLQPKQVGLTPVRLTRKNLAHFNTMAGTKAKDAGSSQTEDKTTTDTSSTGSGFVERIRDNGVVLCNSRRPTNFQDIHAKLSRPDTSAPPTMLEFKKYKRRVERAPNESTVLSTTYWMLLKQYDLEEGNDADDDNEDENEINNNLYLSFMGQKFTGFPENVGFNNNCSAPQPDFVEGLGEKQFAPFPIKAVSGAFLYQDKTFTIVLPHIAGEWKASDKGLGKASTQCAYDGAALVYARTQALEYLGERDPPGEAKVITFAIDGENLEIFAHYSSPAENGAVEYQRFLMGGVFLMGSYDDFKLGRQMLRNAQDFAKEQSEILRDRLLRHGNSPPRLIVTGVEDEEENVGLLGDMSEEEATPPPEPRVP